MQKAHPTTSFTHSRIPLAGIILCLAFSFAPTRADALFVPTNDFMINAQKNLDLGKVFGLDGLAHLAAQSVIDQLTSTIITSVSTALNGSPLYITDLQGFLHNINIEQSLGVSNQIRQSNTCYTTGNNGATAAPWVNPDGSVVYQNTNTGGSNDIVAATIENQARYGTTGYGGGSATCPFTGGQGFRSIEQDGWSGYLAGTTDPSANAFSGKMIYGERAAIARYNAAQAARDEANWNNGYQGQKDCSSGNCITTTPGSVIKNQVDTALTSGLRRLESIDKINELVVAVMNTALDRIFTQAEGLFTQNILQPLSSGINNAIQGTIGNANTQASNITQGVNAIKQATQNTQYSTSTTIVLP
ncbi:MAG: hypothetical protein A2675_00090 [Candidatus Yonathbacteria bacterium RIFCSPHIGHO2_01_FULL_51_10]|uniref:Uncharacterized protein n=1 Tax=Candidatus Yonathbacteria bacterium RIFCSPHIGHO2_01_FULL_51_10 TaxID=1802723 RepID=A0A1G2S8H5_9BACT|nr:MAG: hypothetical protein A2675_00090 [Candidatus Yonathbacteria bacterium RIFCSPHIGHO2_01_FULL_51_10]